MIESQNSLSSVLFLKGTSSRKSMNVLGVGKVHLCIVRVGLRFFHYHRCIEEKMEGSVLKTQVYQNDVGVGKKVEMMMDGY